MTTQPFTNVGRETCSNFWSFHAYIIIRKDCMLLCESFFNPGVALSLTCTMLTNTLIVVILAGALM